MSAEPTGVVGVQTPPAAAAHALQRGEPVIVADPRAGDAGGYVVLAAHHATVDRVEELRSVARGVMCVATTRSRLRDLAIPPMLGGDGGGDPSLHTGVDLAAERVAGAPPTTARIAAIVRALGDPTTSAVDLSTPGWVLPVGCDDDDPAGIEHPLVAGLALAGTSASASAILAVQVLDRDGETLPSARLGLFAAAHGLAHVYADAVRALLAAPDVRSTDPSVTLPIDAGGFRATGFSQHGDQGEHLLLTLGDIGGAEQVPIHIHRECLAGDVFRSSICRCRHDLDEAVRTIASNGGGVIVYLRSSGTDRVQSLVTCPNAAAPGHPRWDPQPVLDRLGVRTTRSIGPPDTVQR